MPRAFRAVLVLFAAFTIGGTAVAVVPAALGSGSATAHAAKPHKKKHKKKKKKPAKPPKPVTLAPGVRVKYHNVKISKKRTVRSALLRLDVRSSRVRLGAATPGNAVGAPRQTITALARANGGIGGINADFFKSGQPLGGLVVNGVMLKSPRRDWDANFYLRGGRARIGPVNFTGSVTRAERPAPQPDPVTDPIPLPTDPPEPTPEPTPATTRSLTSVNALRDLVNDRLVLVTSALASPRFGRACTAVIASPSSSGTVVTAVYRNATAISRRVGTEIALVSCGNGSRAKWLQTKVVTGDRLTIRTSLAGGVPNQLVSGGRQLVKNGRAFNDSDGKRITGRNPEAFGCVSRWGTKIILGTIDGRREGSSGVTLPELARYMLRLHCWSGIVFDGGGSATLVGKPYGRTTVRVLNRPSDRSGARAVTTGLILYRR